MGKVLHVLIVIVCLLGIGAATLAYGEHYNTKPAPCDIDSVWSCGTVNHSSYAEISIAGVDVPVALIGVFGYALLIAVAGRFPWVAFYGALAGFLFSLRLTYIEWKVLESWCLYCVSSQVLILIVMLLTFAAARRSHPYWAKRRSRAL